VVEIVYHRKGHDLAVTGHAGGEKGKDLVCAAVSALVLTLAGNVAELALGDKLCRHRLELGEGNSRIGCVGVSGMGPLVTLVFDTVCSGFELLQTLYPDSVRYRVMQ
jgi:uncharacterized protein YsxB (DUF464 family)